MDEHTKGESFGEVPPWGAGQIMWEIFWGDSRSDRCCESLGTDIMAADVWFWFTVSFQTSCLHPATGINIDSCHSNICLGGWQWPCQSIWQLDWCVIWENVCIYFHLPTLPLLSPFHRPPPPPAVLCLADMISKADKWIQIKTQINYVVFQFSSENL